jgi:hypothetical protein
MLLVGVLITFLGAVILLKRVEQQAERAIHLKLRFQLEAQDGADPS